MKKILFPTEFTDHAPEVFQYALELARRFKAKLYVMHVIGTPDKSHKQGKDYEEITDHIMDVLVDFVEKHKLPQYFEVKIEYLIEVGFPAEAIVNAALDEEVELIVMGMAGKTNALENLFGSVTTAVLAEADAPVLAVPAGYKYRWFHTIVYATDFAFRDIGALNFLKKMARAFGANIDCVHVVEEGEDALKAGVNMQLLKETFKDKIFHQFDILEGELTKEINDYLNEENAGLLVMLSRKRGVWANILNGGRTKEIARKIDLPLLVFKENAYEIVGWNIAWSGLVNV